MKLLKITTVLLFMLTTLTLSASAPEPGVTGSCSPECGSAIEDPFPNSLGLMDLVATTTCDSSMTLFTCDPEVTAYAAVRVTTLGCPGSGWTAHYSLAAGLSGPEVYVWVKLQGENVGYGAQRRSATTGEILLQDGWVHDELQGCLAVYPFNYQP